MYSWRVSPLSSPGAEGVRTPRSPEVASPGGIFLPRSETESASGRLAPLTDPRSKRSTAWSLNKRAHGFGDVGPLSWLVAEPVWQRGSAKCHRPSASARARPAPGWPPFWARSWRAPGVTRFLSQASPREPCQQLGRRSGGGLGSTFKVKVAVRFSLFSFPCLQGEPVASHLLHMQPFPGSGWRPRWRWSWSCWGAPPHPPSNSAQFRTSFVPGS